MRSRHELEVFFRVRERVVRHQSRHMRKLGSLSAQEFSPRRRVEEQIRDRDRSAAGQRSIVDVVDFASGDLEMRSGFFIAGRGFEGYARDRCDRWERFAAEAEGGDGEQFVGGTKL